MDSRQETAERPQVFSLEQATVRFSGDSGDGMQLAGSQFTNTSALYGNDIATLPDYPAEIRAPRGTRAGVSGFQIHFSSRPVFTPGDRLDALVAMNPAALATNLGDLVRGGLLIVDEDAFSKRDLELAGYESNPLEDGTVDGYQLVRVSLTKLTRSAVEDLGLSNKESDRCRNFFALGLVYWIFDRPLEPTLRFIAAKFGKRPLIAEANRRALMAGYHYGETVEVFHHRYHIDPAKLPPGEYRNITGNQATAWGLIAASVKSGLRLFYGTYPITPASDILHELAMRKQYRVYTFQAEDEIAAITSVIGAAFGGALAVTGTSGPGVSLKSEGMGLAVIMELPLVVVNVQRAGPSTGMPTKTEQADLFQALFGRHGECPIPVLAARSPTDCFDTAYEACRLALRYMTPVVVLSDAYLANGSQPWRIPSQDALSPIEVRFAGPEEADGFLPYKRDERLARPWAVPGTPELMHRVGGLEKEDGTGNVSYDPLNHQKMVELRAAKVAKIAEELPPTEVHGAAEGDLLVLTWGSTYGAATAAVRECLKDGDAVGHVHLRHLNPLPNDLEPILRRYRRVLVPELNAGQLRWLIRAKFLIDAVGLNKIQGKPFTLAELLEGIRENLEAVKNA
ncbi:2-oxoacid:acceptor oxidoreductase subunit alpha [Thermostilla marina]